MDIKAKILVVDDEEAIRFSLTETLTRDGHEIVTAAHGEEALDLIATDVFDLVLIDLKLPGIGGMEVLKGLREQTPETIAIVLTAYASLETAVEALRNGAHDYLFKPCKTVELRESIRRGLLNRQRELRQHTLLRQLEQHLSNSLADIRATIVEEPDVAASSDIDRQPTTIPQSNQGIHPDLLKPETETGRFLQRAGLIVDFTRHVITLNNHLLELSPTEFNLLAYLISESPRVVPAQELVREVQGYESEQWEASETVRYHIYRLRQKIKATTQRTGIIRTVRGVGYTIEDVEA